MKRFSTALSLLAAIALSSLDHRAAAQQDFSAELPRIPPTSPGDALKSFAVAEGFRIEQVAAEPLVTSPVAIEWDAWGRLYVCEMRGYSEDREQAISRVSRLEDTDQDGVYETSTVYADGLLWPTAIFPFEGGLFVGDAPNIYYFKDDDGDGVADSRKTVLTGFGTSNVQGLLNSFRWGLDNRIHVACSSAAGRVRRPGDAEDAAINVRGRDISFDPRSGKFTLTSGAAQHGMCFDDWGRKFVSSNSDHIQQVMYEDRYIGRNRQLRPPPSRISIASDGPQAEVFRTSPVEPWRLVRTRLRVNRAVPGPIEGGGRAAGYFTGATGLTIYRGDAWPAKWKGTAIVGDVGSNLIHRKRLVPHGLQFSAERMDPSSEFVTSRDIWFRPAQFANAPDGTLHVIDVCREVIEHPKSLPPQIKRHLDLTAGRERGRIYRIASVGHQHRPTPRLAEYSSAALVETLQHPNAWHRETASRLLWERQDDSIAELLRGQVLDSESPLGRLHALHALRGLNLLDEEVLGRLLVDDHPQLRRHAVAMTETLADTSGLGETLSRLAEDSSIEVRYQLAFTLGSIDHENRVALLAKLISRDPDNRWMQAAVQSSVVEEAGKLFAALMANPEFRSPAAGDFLRKLISQIVQQNRGSDVEPVVAALPDLMRLDAPFALPIIGEWMNSKGGKAMNLRQASGDAVDAEIETLVRKMVHDAARTAGDDSADTASRLDAIGALRFGKLETVETALTALIDKRQPQQVQAAAITTLGKFDSPRVAGPLIETWPEFSPALRRKALEVLFARSDRILALFEAISAGQISPLDIPKTRLQIAMGSKDEKVKALASEYLQAAPSASRDKVVSDYRDCLEMPGDLQRGRTLFRKHCAVCHKADGFGHEIGPNLATIKMRGPETILVNVLDPNREVNPQYVNYIVLTEEGRTVTGMIAAESASTITLRRAESASDTVLRVEIDQLTNTGLSIMPEGMEELIDKQSMADIIAYLMQVK